MNRRRHILIVEDEQTLRHSMVRGLSKLTGVELADAATATEARRAIAQKKPDLVISDLSLPDGSGIDVASELDRLGHRIPIVFISAFLGKYKSRIPTRNDIEVYEKPVPLEQLRSIVERRLGVEDEAPSPFGVADYVQLAGMGRHSVLIEVRGSTGRGEVFIHRGELWSAADKLGNGLEAFRRLAFLQSAQVTCRTLGRDDLPPRNIDGSAESVLLDAARAFDERGKTASDLDENWDAAFTETRKNTVVPPAPPSSRPATPRGSIRAARRSSRPAPALSAAARAKAFDDAYERGVDALLEKDYPTALVAFKEARELKPDDRRVVANLTRLRDMGYS